MVSTGLCWILILPCGALCSHVGEERFQKRGVNPNHCFNVLAAFSTLANILPDRKRELSVQHASSILHLNSNMRINILRREDMHANDASDAEVDEDTRLISERQSMMPRNTWISSQTRVRMKTATK